MYMFLLQNTMVELTEITDEEYEKQLPKEVRILRKFYWNEDESC